MLRRPVLPKTVPILPGVPARIEFDHALPGVIEPSSWVTSVVGQQRTTGANYGDAWYWDDPQGGDRTLQVYRHAPGGALVSEGAVNVGLRMLPDAARDAAATVTVLGDSVVTGGELVAGLQKVMPNLTFDGEFSSGDYSYLAANGADWTEMAFKEQLNGSTPNPAYNPSSGRFDWGYYDRDADVVVANLSHNNAPRALFEHQVQREVDKVVAASETIVGSIKANSKAKMVVALVHPPANQVGFGTGFGHRRTSAQHWRMVREFNAALVDRWDGEQGVIVSIAGHMIHPDHYLDEKAKDYEEAFGVTKTGHGNAVHYNLKGADAWGAGVAPAVAMALLSDA